MAKIKSVSLTFPPSPSSDVVGYKVYMEPIPAAVTHSSPGFDLPGTSDVNLAEVLPGDTDGTFNLGLVAIDDVGNESDFSLINAVPLEFVPPVSPGIGDITYG